MSILSEKAGHDLFVYGSLQDPQVVNVLLNRVPDHFSAVLSGLYVPLSLTHTQSTCLDLVYVFDPVEEVDLWLFLLFLFCFQSQV